jgi:hypothetical protein
MPQPKQISDISKKQNSFIYIAENLVTEEVRPRMGLDVYIVYRPRDGHRENSIEVKGIQDMYQFLEVRSEPGIVRARKDMCFCRFCVLGMFEDCLTSSPWERLNLDVEVSKDVSYLNNIANFYHANDWSQFIDDKLPIVAFKSQDTLQLGILKTKPHHNLERITIKTQKNGPNNSKHIYFSILANSWCLKIDLLDVSESCYGYTVYTVSSSDSKRGILIPMNKLILPGPKAPELSKYYGYFEFITYEKKDYFIQNGRQVNVECYKIKRDALVKIET